METTSSGSANRVIVVNLYLRTDDTSLMRSAVDKTVRTVWAEFPSMPAGIGVSATVGEKPIDAERYEPNAVDPSPLGAPSSL